MRARGVVSRAPDNKAAKRYPPAKQSTSKIPAVSRDTRKEAKRALRPSIAPNLPPLRVSLRRIRVFAFYPVARAAGRIRGIATLRHDPLQAELTGMMEDEGAIFLVQVLVQPQSRRGTRERALKQRLPPGQRFAPRVGPVELDQVEGPHEHVLVTVPSPDQL